MEVDFKSQFEKLKDIIINKVEKLYFGSYAKKQYHGPVQPSSIITFGSDIAESHALVLAEGVPTSQLPIAFGKNLYEAVIVHLDVNYDFSNYNPNFKSLLELNVLIGDKEYSYDGTVKEARSYFLNNNWDLNILYQDNNKN
jgi:hypothetical protein